jgi:hypothetical protein
MTVDVGTLPALPLNERKELPDWSPAGPVNAGDDE